MLMSLVKNIKRYVSLKEILIVFLAVLVSVSAGVGVYLNLIKVEPEDYLSLAPGTELQKFKQNVIEI